MNWKFDNSIPIYTQLVDRFRQAIVSGEFSSGDKLPAVRDISAQAGVNPNTMQRAFQELERLGLVYTLRSSGRYVTEDSGVIDRAKEAMAEEQVLKFLGAMKSLGFRKEQIIGLIDRDMEENNGNI